MRFTTKKYATTDSLPSTYVSDPLNKALNQGGWPVDQQLTTGQIRAAAAVVKAKALNASDFKILADILGLDVAVVADVAGNRP